MLKIIPLLLSFMVFSLACPEPVPAPKKPKLDCNEVEDGDAFMDDCGECVGGDTREEPCVEDCNGDFGGSAYTDECDECVGGDTGEEPCVPPSPSEDAGTTETPAEDAGTTEPPAEDAGTTEPPAVDAGTAEPPAVDAGTPETPTEDAGTAEPPVEDAGAAEPPAEDAGTAPPVVDAGPEPPITGCMNQNANNYNANAVTDDDSCTYDVSLTIGEITWPDSDHISVDGGPEVLTRTPGSVEVHMNNGEPVGNFSFWFHDAQLSADDVPSGGSAETTGDGWTMGIGYDPGFAHGFLMVSGEAPANTAITASDGLLTNVPVRILESSELCVAAPIFLDELGNELAVESECASVPPAAHFSIGDITAPDGDNEGAIEILLHSDVNIGGMQFYLEGASASSGTPGGGFFDEVEGFSSAIGTSTGLVLMYSINNRLIPSTAKICNSDNADLQAYCETDDTAPAVFLTLPITGISGDEICFTGLVVSDADGNNVIAESTCKSAAPTDCHGVSNGTAVADCDNVCDGTAIIDQCLDCVGGTTGEEACEQDCNDQWGGTAYTDDCDQCVGGNTGFTACATESQDAGLVAPPTIDAGSSGPVEMTDAGGGIDKPQAVTDAGSGPGDPPVIDQDAGTCEKEFGCADHAIRQPDYLTRCAATIGTGGGGPVVMETCCDDDRQFLVCDELPSNCTLDHAFLRCTGTAGEPPAECQCMDRPPKCMDDCEEDDDITDAGGEDPYVPPMAYMGFGNITDSTIEVEIKVEEGADIYGIQFDVEGFYIDSATGIIATAMIPEDWLLSSSSSVVLGFSMLGNEILASDINCAPLADPECDATLLLTLEIAEFLEDQVCIRDPILSGVSGSGIAPVLLEDCRSVIDTSDAGQ